MFAEGGAYAMIAFLAVFTLIAVGGLLWSSGLFGDRGRSRERLRELSGSSGAEVREQPSLSTTLDRIGRLVTSKQPVKTADIGKRLRQAGYHHASAAFAFTGLKIMLAVLLTGVGGGLGWLLGWTSMLRMSILCLGGCTLGLMGPELWLNARVAARQGMLRHSLPDALDMLVLCLEGGMSLPAAMQVVSDELWTIYPILGNELNVVQREMQMGLAPGDALKNFANRYDLGDVRDLANVLIQSERYGASLARTLRTYADSARQDRLQKLEESAQQAAVKILFPTLLFIFPAIFVVLLGPAAFQVSRLFQ